MTHEINRRTFVRNSVLAGAGAALAGQVLTTPSAASAAEPAASPTAATADLPRGKIGDLEISRLLLGGNLLTHYTHSRDLTYVYSLAKHYNTDEKILQTLATAEEHGINTVVVHNVRSTIGLLKKHRERGGKMQWITCTSTPWPAAIWPSSTSKWNSSSTTAPTRCTSRAWKPIRCADSRTVFPR